MSEEIWQFQKRSASANLPVQKGAWIEERGTAEGWGEGVPKTLAGPSKVLPFPAKVRFWDLMACICVSEGINL